MAVALSTNLNKVALLRNSRGGTQPSVVVAAERAIAAGARGLTLHWREDERHTRREDVLALRRVAQQAGVEFNLEGDLRAPLIELACALRVEQCTLVPVTPGELTSHQGWRFPRDTAVLQPAIEALKAAGVRVSLFLDAEAEEVAGAAALGASRIELFTEPYAQAFGTARQDAALAALQACAAAAKAQGLGLNAGHDLNLHNLPTLVRALPTLEEVSIGHALIVDALELGFDAAVRAYDAACRGIEAELEGHLWYDAP